MMVDKSKLPPRSPMPQYGLDTIAKFNDQIAALLRQSAGETMVRGLSAGDAEPDARNHSISVAAQLAATAALAVVEILLKYRPDVPLPTAGDIIMGDVDLRVRRAIAMSLAVPPKEANDG